MHFDSIYALGIVQRKKNDTTAAVQTFHCALKIKPYEVNCNRQLAEIHMEHKQWDLALKTLQMIDRELPQHVACQLAMAECNEQLGNWATAEKMYEELPTVHGQKYEFSFGLGRAYYHLQKYNLAIGQLETCLSEQAKPDVVRLLVRCHAETGDADRARSYAKRIGEEHILDNYKHLFEPPSLDVTFGTPPSATTSQVKGFARLPKLQTPSFQLPKVEGLGISQLSPSGSRQRPKQVRSPKNRGPDKLPTFGTPSIDRYDNPPMPQREVRPHAEPPSSRKREVRPHIEPSSSHKREVRPHVEPPPKPKEPSAEELEQQKRKLFKEAHTAVLTSEKNDIPSDNLHAIRLTQNLSRQYPNDGTALSYYARALYIVEGPTSPNMQQAGAKAASLLPDPPLGFNVCMRLGQLAEEENDLQLAQRHYTSAVNNNGQDSSAALSLSRVLRCNGDEEGARQVLMMQCEVSIDRLDTAFEIGSMNEKNGNLDEAAKWYLQAHDCQATPKISEKLFQLHMKRKDPDSASTFVDVNKIESLHQLAVLFLELKKYKEALAWQEKVCRILSNNQQMSHKQYADTLCKIAEQYKLAMPHLLLLAGNRKDRDLFRRAALIQEQQGKLKDARKSWKQTLTGQAKTDLPIYKTMLRCAEDDISAQICDLQSILKIDDSDLDILEQITKLSVPDILKIGQGLQKAAAQRLYERSIATLKSSNVDTTLLANQLPKPIESKPRTSIELKKPDATPRKSFETTPRKSFEATPRKSFDSAPRKSFEATPRKSFDTAPRKSLEPKTPTRSTSSTFKPTTPMTPKEMETIQGRIVTYERALSLETKEDQKIKHRTKLGELYRKTKNFGKAIEHLLPVWEYSSMELFKCVSENKTGTSADPGNLLSIGYDIADSYYQQEQFSEAIDFTETALEMSGCMKNIQQKGVAKLKLLECRACLGDGRANMPKKAYDKLFSLKEDLIENGPSPDLSVKEVVREIGVALAKQSKFSDALKVLEEQSDDADCAMTKLGVLQGLAIRSPNSEVLQTRASSELSKSISAHPHHPLLNYHQGINFLLQTRDTEAVLSFTKCLEASPGVPYEFLCHMYSAIAQSRAGYNFKARESWNHCLSASPRMTKMLQECKNGSNFNAIQFRGQISNWKDVQLTEDLMLVTIKLATDNPLPSNHMGPVRPTFSPSPTRSSPSPPPDPKQDRRTTSPSPSRIKKSNPTPTTTYQRYKKGDKIEYYSSTYKGYLATEVTWSNDATGEIIIGNKPNQKLRLTEQREKCRLISSVEPPVKV